MQMYVCIFHAGRTLFYRFRRRISARIFRPYHQSNRAAREGRHFHVSGETSRRLQSKLREKRRRSRDARGNARLTSRGLT